MVEAETLYALFEVARWGCPQSTLDCTPTTYLTTTPRCFEADIFTG